MKVIGNGLSDIGHGFSVVFGYGLSVVIGYGLSVFIGYGLSVMDYRLWLIIFSVFFVLI